MLKNYLKTAWRNLRQNKSYTLINFSGLALGMTCCVLIALYVKSELSFNDFNKNINRIVAVGSYNKSFGKLIATPYPLVRTLKDKVPEVDKAVAIKSTGPLSIGIDNEHLLKIHTGKYVQPSFFDIFSFKLLKGNKNKVLAAPNSIVLTQKSAKRLFGNEEAVGQSLVWQRSDTTQLLHVTGVVSNPPKNSSIQFGALLAMNTVNKLYRTESSWRSYSYHTFALLNKQTSIARFNTSLQSIARKHYKKDTTDTFFAIPFNSYHLSSVTGQSGFTGNRIYLYFFGSIALFILLIACFNYVNLATARATTRVREVGVRKTLGAGRLRLAGQFIGESVFLSGCSFLAAIFFSYLLIRASSESRV